MSHREVIDLGISINEISGEEIVRICERAQKLIEKRLKLRIGERFLEDYSITFNIERGSDKTLTITIDVNITAPKELGLDYEGIIDDVVDEAFKFIEQELKKYGKCRGVKEGTR